MLPTPQDIFDGMSQQWGLTPSLNNVIPTTSLFHSRIGEGVAWPNARITIAELNRERTSGSLVLIKYRATVEVYTTNPQDAQSVRQGLDTAFDGSSNDASAGLTIANGSVIWSRVGEGGGYMQTGERIDGNDIVRGTAVYTILVQGAR